MSYIGNLSDLNGQVKKSGHKERWCCPYCDSIHGKSPDTKFCMVYDNRKQTGFCFRCNSQIIHEGLRDLDYILDELDSNKDELEYRKAQNQRLKLTEWTTPIEENKKALYYMRDRGFKYSSLKRFNIRACNSPSLGVVFQNKLLDEGDTDFFQIRYIDFEYKHSMLENLVKKACWLDVADTNKFVIVEGFSSGLAAYEHTKKWKEGYLNPIVICGNAMTEIQVRELKENFRRFDKVEIYVTLDGGFFEHSLKVAKKIYERCNNVDIYVSYLPNKSDPNELEYWEYLKCLENSYYYEPNRIQYIRQRVYND